MPRRTQLDRIEDKLERIEWTQRVLIGRSQLEEKLIMLTFEKLRSVVEKNTNATQTMLRVVSELATMVRELGTPEAEALANQIETNAQQLTDAALANTPAAPPVP